MADRHTEQDATSNMPPNGVPPVEDFDRLMRDLAKVLTEPDIREWMTTPAIGMLSVVRHHPQYWGLSKATYKTWGGNTYDLEKAVDHYRTTHDLDALLETATPTVDPFIFTDARTLQEQPSVPRRWLVQSLIANGLTILGGSPKSGKSYLAYALALAVATGGRWCGHWEVESGKVVFVALEDDPDETHHRLEELAGEMRVARGQLFFVHGEQAMPNFDAGALGWIEGTLQHHEPRLLIIDPLSYLYVLKRSGSQFEETKDMLFPLRWLGRKYACAIVCIDHRRKRSRDDVTVFDTLHGSIAKQAVADGLLMIDRQEKDLTVAGIIRNANDVLLHLTMEFVDGRVFLTYEQEGRNIPTTMSEIRMRVFQTLQQAATALSVHEIMALGDMPDMGPLRNTLRQILVRAVHHGEIAKTERDKYIWMQKN
jgi:hypothetical protein